MLLIGITKNNHTSAFNSKIQFKYFIVTVNIVANINCEIQFLAAPDDSEKRQKWKNACVHWQFLDVVTSFYS